MATLTVTAAFTALTDVKKNINNIGSGAKLRMANYINQRIYNEWLSQDASSFISTATINVLDDTATYSLPADFRDIDNSLTQIRKVSTAGDITDEILRPTGKGSPHEGYYIEGDNLVLTPTPSGTSTLSMDYIADLTELTAVGDAFVVGTRWLELVRAGLIHQYDIFNKDPASEQESEQRFTFLLDEFISKISRKPKVLNLTRLTV